MAWSMTQHDGYIGSNMSFSDDLQRKVFMELEQWHIVIYMLWVHVDVLVAV